MASKPTQRSTSGRQAVRGAAGGKAGETGSLHRSGVAAYLAAHGLAGQPISEAGYLPGGPTPIALSFETHEAVDDICCTMTDRSRLLIQAKRACGVDKDFRTTVAQWTDHIPNLQSGDRIALATAEPSGSIKHLNSALERRRRAHPGLQTSQQNQALADLNKSFAANTSEERKDAVRDAAFVLQISASTRNDPHFKAAAYLLDGTVVPNGDGTKAFEALQRAFQEQAAAGTGSGIDNWLQTLTDAGIAVRSAADGPVGPRREAQLSAVAAYRARWRQQRDKLEYSLLGDGLPAMHVPNLADSFRVSPVIDGVSSRFSDDLVKLARHWTRMALTGLPGMGKTTALEQLAALWSSIDDAPLPILVRLAAIARRVQQPGDVTLPLLIAEAVEVINAPVDEQEPLRLALEEAVANGTAVLLLDGLDETGSQRGTVVGGLHAVIGNIPELSGVIIAMRPGALATAASLGLPEARLVEPLWLIGTLRRLLQHVADHRLPEDERDQWVEDHQKWLDDAQGRDHEIWSVPLLATLLTLLSTVRSVAELPKHRPELLAEAVRESVRRWEKAREAGALREPWSAELTDAMLIDGYASIGHLLNAGAPLPIGQCERVVTDMLASRWRQSPGASEQIAGEIIRFWDDKVGVFVTRDGKSLEARSRVFSEIGDAMWVASQDSRAGLEWAAKAVRNQDRSDTVLLAAGLSEEITAHLIEIGAGLEDAIETDMDRALVLAAHAITTGQHVDDVHLEVLVDALASAAQRNDLGNNDQERRQASTGFSASWRRDNARWRLTRSLAALPVSRELRDRRDGHLSEIPLDADQRVIAAAFAALTDARVDDCSTLTPSALEAVRSLLELPLTPTGQAGESVQSGPGERKKLWTGHVDAAELAIKHLDQLPPTAASTIYEVAQNATVHQYSRIGTALEKSGHPDPRPILLPPVWRADIADTVEQADAKLWEAFVGISSDRVQLTRAEQWRVPELFALSAAVSLREMTLIDCGQLAIADSASLIPWARATARAAGIELTALASQAAHLLALASAERRLIRDVLASTAPPRSRKFDAAGLVPEDIDALIDAIVNSVRWVAHIAMCVLEQTHNPSIAERIEAQLPLMAIERQSYAATLICMLSDDSEQSIETLLGGDDHPLRVGAARALRWQSATEPGRLERLTARAMADNDMVVRLLAGASQESAMQAAYWSCLDCGQTTVVVEEHCSHCGEGTRPGGVNSVDDD